MQLDYFIDMQWIHENTNIVSTLNLPSWKKLFLPFRTTYIEITICIQFMAWSLTKFDKRTIVKIIINFIFFNNDNYLPEYLGGTITKISIKEIKNIQYAF